MSEAGSGIKWDSGLQALSGWTTWDNRRVRICIPRDLIHTISVYNDAIESEIEQFKDDITERLKPILMAQAAE
jgi:hypothetical protein